MPSDNSTQMFYIKLMKNTIKKHNRYLVLLVDRKRARMFTLHNGAVEQDEKFINTHVPQKVKHGDDTWDAQDKIFRHIEDHLHRHLTSIAQQTRLYAAKNHITAVVIGSHKPLFSKIKKHLPYLISQKVKGTFTTELKAPFSEILERAKILIDKIENK